MTATPTAHAANYARESNQRTMTASELYAELGKIIADGKGERPTFIQAQRDDGLTHALPVTLCFSSEPYDGDLVWICSPGL
jgi:hypothetical protein